MKNWTAKNISILRKRLKLTQEAFATRLGVSFTTVNRWERGHSAPSKSALKALEALSKRVS